MSERRCPVCGRPVGERSENPSFPFCSERCRLIDLGKWLTGSYRVPDEFVEEDEVFQPPTGDEEE